MPFSASLADGLLAAATLLPVVGLALLERLGAFGRVLAGWSRASPARPAETVDELYQRGLDARESGRAGMAVKAFQEVVRRAPAHAEAHARLSELAHERGDGASALLHALQAWREDSRPSRALAAAAAYRAAGRGADSIALYRDVLGRDADHPAALRHLRDALGDLGRWGEAVALQERLVKLAPPDERAAEQAVLAAIHYEVGADRLRRHDAPGAIAALRESLRVRADFLPAAVALGDAHARAGEPSQALRVWERALDAAPALPLLSRLEQAYRAEGRPRRMIGLYEEA
ncbi:MAG TPA: tetratricopeptide repeat protein, partial [Candidatus Limnocylindrales bacterium]|nr:tetratricopeptide repeat protein [Candidatus Limnocylindrales bacterium]